MAERSEGLSQEEAGRWFFETAGVRGPAVRVEELVGQAVRHPAGDAATTLAQN
ncbi:hypothetical protein AB5J56_05075 [Streptomyces sp. R21]|uniref:Uncharacterized protein n=1 Tax=Streptomyces sp. R21 TaxID=3238627 RepID=A0AB39P4N1_9ACTN